MSAKQSKYKGITVSHGNLKLDASIGIFNLPAGAEYTCSQDCPGCYAKKAQKLYPSVLPCRMSNWTRSQDGDFVSDMIHIIKKANFRMFRIHESGDFYAHDYAVKWQDIITACPNVRFYCYTKESVSFVGKNINVVNSWLPDGELNYGNAGYLAMMQEKYRFLICPATLADRTEKVKCGRDCTACLREKYVLFKIH